MMRRALDMFGAEVIAPLHAHGTIIGWIFFGHRVTGQLFDDRDLEYLTTLAEHVSTILENAILADYISKVGRPDVCGRGVVRRLHVQVGV